ncbi:ImmA/IrrE family metallo-endopeptidase [Clostridium algidicarnis]|uniref:Zn-dependent peptidase ImmA (M78 family) n=1 Tax=Clostridium algidicarnis DSM 15099 TaxID=1121295 RepID=A0A2S6FU30_9CLOT|nr:ImmA/IrrE family metallo-endopeptidase [Clostridium algidicarnis]MBU3205206.1 ImmA/IrrE family metallo-endopeptidase [Clostridium algidicarnis]MBU3213359.1 ImmA/IrrE family metallo-endopeptidase [Clostridium algidicarnis]MBU3223302.1 ImmA/IrrE family metallo-endopeptidase [Clostridium algidicarnis]PPK43232.1 Zn-dependent peptidase ImmA (M78 family) [Clostridium algidicarnis DSM 15099]
MDKKKQLSIEKMADLVRDECKVTDYGFNNIFEAAGKIGYRVIRYPIGSDSFLGFALIKDTERIIFTNSSSILAREIFTIAHEIGHHRLHLSELGLTVIKDDDFHETNDYEVEANYFAACLLMPRDKVEKFIRLELEDKEANKWNGLDIARIQTEFSVSYDMALIRLEKLGLINSSLSNGLKIEKAEKTTSRLLNAINGNVDLCKPAEVKNVPPDYLQWVISNYNEKLIPFTSLEKALNYLGLKAEDVADIPQEEIEEEYSLDDLIGRME